MIKTSILDIDQIKILPYIDCDNLNNRIVPILPYYDGTKWQIFIYNNDEIIPLEGQPSEGDYFASKPEKDSDIYFDFLNFIVQRAFWPNVGQAIDSLRNDLHNLGASLGKFQLFYEVSSEKKLEVTRFVASELEYIFIVCRSIFDLLQKVISQMWDKIEFVDKNINKRQIPESFRKMILSSNKLMDVGTITNKFKIPPLLAEFYYRHASFFFMLREYRDNITHRGLDFKSIFNTEKGFAINKDKEPFSTFKIWNKEHLLPNNLASLRPVIAYLIIHTIEACEDFSATIQKIIVFPPDIAPNSKLFIRGYHNKELIKLDKILNDCLWWDE
ncbi:hypothetical protein H8E88_02870 [candidate division KSB1 bacterium]|nr:hypothetical protein [candidate division KSB1 bacterium]